jgi:hypothetical protein
MERHEVATACKLREVIEEGSFWTISDRDPLRAVAAEFSEELERLKNAYYVRTVPTQQERQ